MPTSLNLKFPQATDVDAVYEAVTASMAELHRWMDWCTANYCLDRARQWVDAQADARSEGSAFGFIIVGPENHLLGACGINQIDQTTGIGNLGYWVRSSAAGQGVATTAVREVVTWSFAETSLDRLEIVAAVGNIASQRVARKVDANRLGVVSERLSIHGQKHEIGAR